MMTRARVEELNSARLTSIHPVVAEKGIAFIGMCESHLGLVMFVISGLRTFAEQEGLYAKGRWGRYKKSRIVTKAKPGQSYHNYGLALDYIPLIQVTPNTFNLNWNKESFLGPAYKKARKLAVDMGFEIISWDRPHLQYRGDWNWRDLLMAGFGQTRPIAEITLPTSIV